jgi:hypothetical protein
LLRVFSSLLTALLRSRLRRCEAVGSACT